MDDVPPRNLDWFLTMYPWRPLTVKTNSIEAQLPRDECVPTASPSALPPAAVGRALG